MLKEKLFDIFRELEHVFEDEQNRLIPYLVYVFDIYDIDTGEIRNISIAMKLKEEGKKNCFEQSVNIS